MTTTKPALARAVLLALLAILLSPVSGECFQVSHSTAGDLDEVVLRFDSPGARYGVRRVDRQAVEVAVEGEPLAAAPEVSGGRQVASVRAAQGGARIETTSPAFGYIVSPLDATSVRIQFFPDPIGARWEPRGAGAPTLRELAPGPAAQQAPATPGPESPGPESPGPQAAPPIAADSTAQANQAVPVGGAGRPSGPSLFAVPYSVRVHVNGGADREITVEPGEVVAYDPDTGTVRIRARSGEPREVAAATPPDLQRERQRGAATQAEAPPALTPDATPDSPAASPVPTTPGSDLPAEGPALEGPLLSIVPGQGAAPQQPPAETAPASPPDGQAPDGPLPQGFYARVMRSLTGTPEPQGAPAPAGEIAPPTFPPMSPEEAAQAGLAADAPAQEAPAEALGEPVPQVDDAAVQGALEDIQAGRTSPERAGQGMAQDSPQDRFAGLTEEEAKRMEGLELQLLKAQSQIASGHLEEAREALEEVLNDPLLPDDMRQEAVYSLGSVLMTLYKDTPREHFNEITSLYQEAINADVRSPNVPTAIMNLGLINLWAGNMPEAKAYFDILTSEYPQDENIPSIGYHYGEYFFKLGEYEKAADLFQQFIETHPEQERMARQAAMYLAESLMHLGLYDQAFQIVDYIDKRWPQAYEETPSFLKLAGDVEHRLGMDDQAKTHYWTYYNMNPKADEADLVLARLGDIYLGQNEPEAARELYNRTINEYPGMEGALISKMRLAEEGIHDEPTFMEMVTVFDKPYSLRPKQVYTEIVDEHPDSPLAPLALLKLGMWHFFQQEYADALAAAQRMFTEYPDSPLLPRAKELGDRSFALAVPQLLEQKNWQLVVDYWERYDFASMSDSDDADSTRIGVAKSYAELDRFEPALDLLKPYLGKEQKDTYSELALAVALDVYLKQHAWNRIEETARLVEDNWNVSDRIRRLLLHAEAVAMENLGQTDKAVRLWAQLGADEDVEPFIRADAMYHLAKEAMNHQDLRRVFVYAQEALSQLLVTDGDTEKIKDCLRMSIYATERSGRYQQALKWAEEYDKYVPEDDPEWAASRYRLARIYRKAGASGEWRGILEGIRDKQPDTLYGRLAATALETDTLEGRAQEFAPVQN
ncbi:MAG: tetratricopeptide repeat protein [Desulfovibrionaceae bacterium]